MHMSVLTEAALRILLKDEDLDALKEYRVAAGVIVTPAAKAYLIDHRIGLVVGGRRIIKTPGAERAGKKENARGGASDLKKRDYGTDGAGGGRPGRKGAYSGPGGESYEAKPEFMTALRGTELVFKDHKIIRLRGKIDSFEAKALETALAARRGGAERLAAELGEVLDFARTVMRCEVLAEPVPPMRLFGLDEAEIRERSHFPQKYYNVPHFMPITVEDGEHVLMLNTLRTMAREVELCAYAAFRGDSGEPAREDIALALNRLSSAIYLMMLRAKAGEYA
jgi:ethanolamine utilization cobalamin adenosyltransferase